MWHGQVQETPWNAKWKQQIDDWRKALGCVGFWADLKPWTSLPGRQYQGISRSPRVMAILDTVAIHVLGGAAAAARALAMPTRVQFIEAAMRNTIVDISQNPIRRAFSNSSGEAKCLTTSSTLYSYRRDSLMLPLEKLFVQGHGRDTQIPDSMTCNALEELAGMGISLPCLATLLIGVALSTGLSTH